MSLVYPRRLGHQDDLDSPQLVSAFARASSSENAVPFDLVLPLSDQTLAFVGEDGRHVPARLSIVPGYPDALPQDIRVSYAGTQQRGASRRKEMSIVPLIRVADAMTPAEGLAFQIRIEGLWQHAVRVFAVSIVERGVPYLIVGGLLIAAALGGYRLDRLRRVAQEKRLMAIYGKLREEMALGQWAQARLEIDQLQRVRPHYRDVDQLEGAVNSAETATHRRERLYREGVRAYRERDWPRAAQAFAAVEREDRYYGDVRFFRRTAALYADLLSRDRSLRAAAAESLGKVADLLDAAPLLDALGDGSEQVADAAEGALALMGLQAFDVLLPGLAHELPAVRERAYRLVERQGQGAREPLTEALRSRGSGIARPVSALLARLGAIQELADALQWASPLHQESIVGALIGEGVSSCGPLIRALLRAPLDRQQVLINALAAVKSTNDIESRLYEASRATKDQVARSLLQRAIDATPTAFYSPTGAPAVDPSSRATVVDSVVPARSDRPRRLRLLDRRSR